MATSDAERLAAAETALHDLLSGNGVSYIRDSSGEAVSYEKADIGRLEAYIARLKLRVNRTAGRPLQAWL